MPGWDAPIDPMLFEVSTGTTTPAAPMQSQLTLASSSSELANALTFPAQYYQEEEDVEPPQSGPGEDASAGCISPAMLQGSEDPVSTPAEDPAGGNVSDGSPRYCSVKGCKAVIPGSYEYKMCPPCRTRYRGYGITKRKKWKAERQAFEHEMADSPEELRAWELSILDEQITLPPQVVAALNDGDGEGGSTSAAPSILSLYQNDPNQKSDVDSLHAIAPYPTVLAACTKLKRVREKEEKAMGPREGAKVVEIPPEATESHASRKNTSQAKSVSDGQQVSESKSKRAKKGTHCATEGCGNPLSEEKRWRHCEACRLAEREKKLQAKAAEGNLQATADSPSAEEDSVEAAANDSEHTTNDPPDANVDSQQLRLVNMSANSFENSESFRWNVESAQVSGTPMPSIDLSRPPSQQPPLTIKHYDPNGEKEPIIRSTPNLQPYVTVEQFPFKDVATTLAGESSVGIAITPDPSAAATTTTVTLTMQDDAALTSHTPYPDAGVFRHYVVPPKDKDASASQPIPESTPVPVADSGPSIASATDSPPAPPAPLPAPPTQSATQPVGTRESATPSAEKTLETSASTGKKKAASSTKSKPKSKGKGKAADPPSSAEAPAQPPLPPQPSLYPYHPYYLFPPAQYAQYATASAYGLMYPPLHPSALVPESISTSQAIPPAPAFYYPPPYPYAASAPVPGLGVPPPPSSLVHSYHTVSGGTVSAPVDGLAPGTAAATSISAPPAAAPPPPPPKPRPSKKQKEPKSLFNYYHPGYGTTDSPELPAGAEPGKRKRRKIDPAWLEKMRLKAEEEKRAAAGDAPESASAGPSTGADASGSASAVATSVPSAHVGTDVDAELVSAVSSAHESEAEVEQCLDHAQEQEQERTGLDSIMDEDDPHVDETRAPEVSSSRLSERGGHGSPQGNAQSKPCYNKTCRRRVVSTSATGGSTFCEKCKAKFKKHAEKNRVIMDPHVDDDVEKGSPRQNEKELPPDPRFEQRTERESGLIVEEPEEIQSPGPAAQEVNTRFQEQVQELQHELSDFLAQHVARTLNLQNSLHNEPLKFRKHLSGVMHERDNSEYLFVLLAR
ncbi:hypothetical protein H1R20_g12071, partial [Candolleomyces eurysporus]